LRRLKFADIMNGQCNLIERAHLFHVNPFLVDAGKLEAGL